jgi:hypothetical protein
MAEMRKGLGGMGRMGNEFPGSDGKKPAAKMATTEGMDGAGHDNGEEKISTITHHADGTHTSQMHGAEPEEHPDHLHLMAHIGHSLSGGDAHHVMHHDGMEAHSHMVNEGGEHEDGGSHNTADEAKQSLDKFFGEEAEEPEHEHEDDEEEMPVHGGMGA